MNELDTGALGASGRFARMEAALDRIESKLDLKADLIRVTAVEGRMQALEQLITDMVTGKTTSALGQLYLQKFNDMEVSIEKLERGEDARLALLTAAKSTADSRFRWFATGVGALSAGGALLSVLALVK